MVEVTRQINTAIEQDHKIMRKFKKYAVENTALATQKLTTTTWVRFKVTACLYLILNNRARSLSTLIAVNVNRDTLHKMI